MRGIRNDYFKSGNKILKNKYMFCHASVRLYIIIKNIHIWFVSKSEGPKSR